MRGWNPQTLNNKVVPGFGGIECVLWGIKGTISDFNKVYIVQGFFEFKRSLLVLNGKRRSCMKFSKYYVYIHWNDCVFSILCITAALLQYDFP